MTDPRLIQLAQMPLHLRAARIAELFAEGVDDQQPPATSRAQRRDARARLLVRKPARLALNIVQELRFWLAPSRAAGVARALVRVALDWVTGENSRRPGRALRAPEGFCGRAASLAPDYLIEIFGRGMVPRNFLGLSTLWSPPVRAMLRPQNFPRGAHDDSRSEACRISLDESFDSVLANCAKKYDVFRKPALDLALGDLYESGFAHSLEIWDHNGGLIAGAIGVACGGVFILDRAWFEDDEALERGVNNLAYQLQRWNFSAIDFTAAPELATRLGCGRVTRHAFAEQLASAACSGLHGHWRIDPDLRAPARRVAPPALKLLARAQSFVASAAQARRKSAT